MSAPNKNPPPRVDPKVRQDAQAADEEARTSYLLGPKASRPKLKELTDVPYRAPMIVEGYLPQDAGGDVAPGGTGKSTLLLYEGVHIVLGLPLYGRKILRAGAVLFITAEDSRDIMLGRLNEICRALELTPKQINKVIANFHIEDVSACGAKLVVADRYGAAPTSFIDEIITKYKTEKLAMVVLDPTSLLGPGETSGNDGLAELMRTTRMVSRELQASVRLVHHVSQAVARGNIHDQYVGRGGTAFADNSRSQRQISVLVERKIEHEGNTYELPVEVTNDELKSGRVLAIFVHKLSYAERDSTPIIVVRHGFAYRHVPVSREPVLAQHEREEKARNDVQDFIRAGYAKGVKYTKDALDKQSQGLGGLERESIREAVKSLLSMGIVVLKKLPREPGHKQGRPAQYLHPAGESEFPAIPAISRHKPPAGFTEGEPGGRGFPAADGTSTRRRTIKGENPRKKTGGSGTKKSISRRNSATVKEGITRRNSATVPAPHNGLNGQGVH